MPTINELHAQLNQALKAADSAQSALILAEQAHDKAYDEWYAKFSDEHTGIIQERTNAINQANDASALVASIRAQIKAELEGEFRDDLPEGISQHRKLVATYDPQGMLKQAIQHAPFLLQINDKMVQTFFTTFATKAEDEAYILPEEIRSLFSVEVIAKPQPRISDATIRKLNIEPVVAKNEATEPIISEEKLAEELPAEQNSPTDELEATNLHEKGEKLPF